MPCQTSPVYRERSARFAAFTLIELLTVVAIIGILAAITLGVSRGVQERAAINQARSELSVLATALEAYKRQYGDYPQPSNGTWTGMTASGADRNPTRFLQALLAKRGPLGAAIDGKAFIESSRFNLSASVDPADSANQNTVKLVDPWGRDYYYFYKETGASWTSPGYVLMSLGPDGFSIGTTAAPTVGSGATNLIQNSGELRSGASSGAGSSDNLYAN